ncbi:MAG: hypothetical protein ACXW4Z_24085, partial [Candidatus Binatia bacterium]
LDIDILSAKLVGKSLPITLDEGEQVSFHGARWIPAGRIARGTMNCLAASYEESTHRDLNEGFGKMLTQISEQSETTSAAALL